MESKGLLKLLKLDSLVEHLTGYAEDKIELFKIEAKEELSTIITKAIIILLIIVFASFFLLFLSLALAIYLNHALQTQVGGYAIMAIAYLIILVTVFMLKDSKSLHKAVEKSMSGSDNEDI